MKAAAKPLVWAEIDLRALDGNLAVIRRVSRAPKPDVLAVVKADAYGHGMAPVSRRLWSRGVRLFAVANIDEARELLHELPRATVLVLGSFHKDQVDEYIRLGVRPTLSSIEDLGHFAKRLKPGRRFPVHVKVDTGMGRLGVWHEHCRPYFAALKAERRVAVEGLYTHFSSADAPDGDYTRKQLALFERAAEAARKTGLSPRYFHAANSLGILRFARSHLNLIRPGLILYGLDPGHPGKLPAGIRPVMSWKARITFLKRVEKGRPLSYGRTFRTSRATTVATLPVGYSHGYKVAFSNRSDVLVGGKRCPVLGRVTMDQTLVDTTHAGRVGRWDEAVLLGKQGGARVTAEELARHASTISYEIVCSVHPKIPRFYRK